MTYQEIWGKKRRKRQTPDKRIMKIYKFTGVSPPPLRFPPK